MNNWTIIETVNYFINKYQVGNAFTPSQAEEMLNYASLNLLKKRLGPPEEGGRGMQGYSNTTRILKDLAPFIVNDQIVYSSGVSSIPDGLAYPLGMTYEETTCAGCTPINVELLNNGELSMREISSLKPITVDYPVYTITDKLNIYPSSISVTKIVYIKNPKLAVFTTITNANGELEYDSVNSVELEWDDLAKLDIINLILSGVGLNLRSSEIMQVSESIKQRGI